MSWGARLAYRVRRCKKLKNPRATFGWPSKNISVMPLERSKAYLLEGRCLMHPAKVEVFTSYSNLDIYDMKSRDAPVLSEQRIV